MSIQLTLVAYLRMNVDGSVGIAFSEDAEKHTRRKMGRQGIFILQYRESDDQKNLKMKCLTHDVVQ